MYTQLSEYVEKIKVLSYVFHKSHESFPRDQDQKFDIIESESVLFVGMHTYANTYDIIIS